jgi:dipeptidyl-peptidase-3
MLAYSAAVFDNHGNYKSFGDTKFVPELESEKFKKVIEASDSYSTHKDVIDNILNLIEKEIYSETELYFQIGFPDANG